jgi:hypothetical protein
MKPKVYLETTIVSYLTAWPSRQIVMAANQEITRDWWADDRQNYDLFVSQIVLDESSAGDPDAAQRRWELLKDLPRLVISEEAVNLARELAAGLRLPTKAKADALHIAISAANAMDYLLTWNCSHIANAKFRLPIEDACRQAGYEPPVICTPQELLERREDHD